ncbi:MAG: type IV pilin N-terminal domain-containing protein [archaeon]
MIKKGVSPVIASVLMVLVTIVAVALISAFLIPLVKDNLTGGGNCFKVIGKLDINTDTGYTCYNITGDTVLVMVERGYLEEDIDIVGLNFYITAGAERQSYEVTNGDSDPGIRMYNESGYNSSLYLPKEGGALTYVFDMAAVSSTPEAVEVSAVLDDGKVCDPVFSNLPKCAVF